MVLCRSDGTASARHITANTATNLVLATATASGHRKRAAVTLKAEVKTVLNGVRRDRSTCNWTISGLQLLLPLLTQYQPWSTGNRCVNAQLVMDLGGIYQQKFSSRLKQLQEQCLMIKLGLVELSDDRHRPQKQYDYLCCWVSSTGVSAAYLTSVSRFNWVFPAAGSSYKFWNWAESPQVKSNLQNVFQQNQQLGFLQY